MTFTHQLTRLYLEFKDDYTGEHTFHNFMMWLKDEDTDNNPYRYDTNKKKLCDAYDTLLECMDEADKVVGRKSPYPDVMHDFQKYPHTVGRRLACLTGQQWYDRFYNLVSDTAITHDSALKAARIAAFMEEDHENQDS